AIVTVTDGVGCIAVTSVTITQPTQISNIILVSDATCYGLCDGEAIAITSGGVSPYSYSWNMGAVNDTVYNLVAGTYIVTITDANGCTLIDTAIIDQAAQITASASGTGVSCYDDCDGTATVTPGGGIPPYTYLWSNAETTQTVANLCAGTYYVTVYDITGCYNIDSVTITQPDSLVLVITTTDDYGSGDGTATASVTGGTPPCTYFWSTTGTNSTITGLIAGVYTVTATDANGCYVIGSDSVHLNTSVVIFEGEQNIALYPNPTHGMLNLDVSGVHEEFSFMIYDVSGKLVYSTTYKPTGIIRDEIDLSGNAEGLYIIKLTGSTINKVEKIILR
ncbi:MAG: T9SS type A sorting domain-containing protein, partial [Bacteroidota bacterium]